jgi:choline dehydrogenase-like flavoprotein
LVAILEQRQYDAVVIGSGMTSGWAAKELSERGLSTLVLEAGREIVPERDYEDHTAAWELRYRGLGDLSANSQNQPIQSQCYACDEWGSKFFVNDHENPYSVAQGSPDFRWIRGRQVGGRSIMWARQSYRFSDLDFEANARDGHGVDWPIRYRDLEPWYDYVERFVGISGQRENLPQLPDGDFLPALPLNVMEEVVRERLESSFGGQRRVTPARVAVLTRAIHGRRVCHHCGPCRRGCRTRSYFSSLTATLPAAESTGNMTLRPDSVVAELLYDETRDRVTGARVIDSQTKESFEVYGRIVFLCASTIESARLLLNTRTPRFPTGLANSSDQVGRNLMDHLFQIGGSGEMEGLEDRYTFGYRPGGFYIPRFSNLDQSSESQDFVRGFGYQGSASREHLWHQAIGEKGFGADYKKTLSSYGPWRLAVSGFGECLPKPDNRVEIDPDLVDKWGIPAVRISMAFGDNEQSMRKEMQDKAAEILEAAGARNIRTHDAEAPPGFAIHEMGTARMGRDPRTSVLNGWCQSWDVPNLFIPDGAAMASSACQNPSLTYMALTARACDYAIGLMRDGKL